MGGETGDQCRFGVFVIRERVERPALYASRSSVQHHTILAHDSHSHTSQSTAPRSRSYHKRDSASPSGTHNMCHV